MPRLIEQTREFLILNVLLCTGLVMLFAPVIPSIPVPVWIAPVLGVAPFGGGLWRLARGLRPEQRERGPERRAYLLPQRPSLPRARNANEVGRQQALHGMRRVPRTPSRRRSSTG
jgi:hypothetical protein